MDGEGDIGAPYFLATKVDAFLNRGEGDYYGSHDLEDLIVVVDGRPEIVDEVRTNATPELRAFLRDSLDGMWSRLTTEALPGALRGDEARALLTEARMRAIRLD